MFGSAEPTVQYQCKRYASAVDVERSFETSLPTRDGEACQSHTKRRPAEKRSRTPNNQGTLETREQRLSFNVELENSDEPFLSYFRF